MYQILAFLLAVATVASSKSTTNFGCQPTCWDSCLNAPGSFTEEYENFRELISKVRAVRFRRKAHGALFLLDTAAENQEILNYQQVLTRMKSEVILVSLPLMKDPSSSGVKSRGSKAFWI